jgi:putative endonuclease
MLFLSIEVIREEAKSMQTGDRTADIASRYESRYRLTVQFFRRCMVSGRSTKSGRMIAIVEARHAGLGTRLAAFTAMTVARQRLGERGETMACEALEKLGYAITATRYRNRFGEIDIVANDNGTVVFVEVKTKTDCSFSDPVESVTKQKQRRLVSMAEQYVAYHRLDSTPCRFDVVTVDISAAPSKITHYKDAFRPGW